MLALGDTAEALALGIKLFFVPDDFSTLYGWLGVIFGFSSLIFVHEMGHFLLAKWNGVRVHVFSIGMGPYVLSYTKGETVYVLSLVPIGGYVKMAGQDDLRPDLPENKDPHDYRNKKPGQKAAILAAGAIFNLIYAMVLFTLAFYQGVEMKTPRVGDVVPDSPLAQAEALAEGDTYVPRPLQKGDLILSVNGEAVKSDMEVLLAAAGSGPGNPVWITYARPRYGADQPERDPVRVITRNDARFGAATIGWFPFLVEHQYRLGFDAPMRVSVASDPKEDSPAGKAGIKKGDVLVSVDGEALTNVPQLMNKIRAAEGKPQQFAVMREGETLDMTIAAEEITEGDKKVYLVGLPLNVCHPVLKIDPASEAYALGLREGYWLREVNPNRDETAITLAFYDPLDPERTAQSIRIKNDGSGPEDMALSIYLEQMHVVKADGVFEALGMAWDDLVRHSVSVFTILRGLLTGNVSPKSLSSAVGIGKATFDVSMDSSFMKYLWFIAFISVNLGVLQFVPIPLLDGWHLLMILVEKLKGGPVAPRIQEGFQYVGLFIILSLLIYATKNDLMRIFGQP
ncbi:MAG: zinc metalloprotease [Planctomycetota bacterium]